MPKRSLQPTAAYTVVIRDKSLSSTQSVSEAVAGHCRWGWRELRQGLLMWDLKTVQAGDSFPGHSWCLDYFRLTQWKVSPPFLWGLLCSIRQDRTGGTAGLRSFVQGYSQWGIQPKFSTQVVPDYSSLCKPFFMWSYLYLLTSPPRLLDLLLDLLLQ